MVAGAVRIFVKGATEKAREKIKALYGVDISDKVYLLHTAMCRTNANCPL